MQHQRLIWKIMRSKSWNQSHKIHQQQYKLALFAAMVYVWCNNKHSWSGRYARSKEIGIRRYWYGANRSVCPGCYACHCNVTNIANIFTRDTNPIPNRMPLMQQRLQEVRSCINIRHLYGASRNVVNSVQSTLVEVLDAMLVIVIYYNRCDIT